MAFDIPNKKAKEVEMHPEAMKYDTDFYDIDAMLLEVSKPKQPFEQKNHISDRNPERVSANDNENSSAAPDYFDPTQTDREPKVRSIAPKSNKLKGKASMEALDLGLSYLMMGIAGENDRGKFKASEPQKEDISEALGEYLEDKPFDLPPWFTPVMIIAGTYFPKGMEAFRLRKLKEHDKRLDVLEKKMKIRQNEQKEN